MKQPKRLVRRLNREVAIRIAADAVLVNVAFLLAMALRVLWTIWSDPTIDAQALVERYVQIATGSTPLLTLLAVTIFGASGFYTHGRTYQGRYKLLVILQAVSLTYLVLALAIFLIRDWLPALPRAGFILAWALTLALVGSARLWARMWRRVVLVEERLFGQNEPKPGIRSVLVIGGAGYIGSTLCRQLLEKGYRVRALDALLYGDASIRDLRNNPHFDFIEGDTRDVQSVVQAMWGTDAVVHLGEIVGDPATALDERLTIEINLAATRLIAEVAKGYGANRFVYASSCSVYGTGNEILDEQSRLNPVSLYARTKISAEQALLDLNGPGFDPVILRFATVYGLSPRPRFDLVINLLTAKAVRDGQITIFGGNQWRPFVHVSDVARAIVRCLEAPALTVKGQIFNVGSDEQNMTITQLGDVIQSLIPTTQVVNQGDDSDNRNYHVSFDKIRNRLGFVPEHTVADGVLEIEAALRNGQLGDYQDKKYSNYKSLSEGNHLSFRSRHINELYTPFVPGETTREYTSSIATSS